MIRIHGFFTTTHRRHSTMLRLVAGLLVPLQVLFTIPPSAFAAGPQLSAQPGTGGPSATRGPVPDAALISAQMEKEMPANMPVDRTAKPVNGHGGLAALPAQPTMEQLAGCGLLSEPLLALGTVSAEENAALAAAVRGALAKGGRVHDLAPLAAFAEAWPRSAWRASVLLVLGKEYRQRGYFTRAIDALQEGWRVSRAATAGHSRTLAEEIGGELAIALADANRGADLKILLAQTKTEKVTGSPYQKLLTARALLAPVDAGSAIPGGCGLVAMETLHRAVSGSRKGPKILSSSRERARLGLETDAHGTLTFAQLNSIGVEAGLGLKAGKRIGTGPFPAPAILHWKRGHFAAVVKRSGSRYLVQDPGIGGDRWMEEAALAEECSGYALVAGKKLPAGWAAVGGPELSKVIGRSGSSPTPANDPNTEEDDCDECEPCKGMAGYSISRAYASLRVKDTPLSYSPATGGSIDFTINYSQRRTQGLAVHSYFGFGRQWTGNFLSYVEDNTHWDWTETSDGYDGQWSGSAKVFKRGGGSITYSPTSQKWVFEGSLPFPAPPAHPLAFENDWKTHVGLVRTTDGDYERRLADGTIEIFDEFYLGKVWLGKIRHPNGSETDYIYDRTQTHFRLGQIKDADGQISTFHYEAPGWRHLITKITDPLGRTAVFGYVLPPPLTFSPEPQLISITDPVGIVSQFGYDAAGLIKTLTTPYGATLFDLGETENGNLRWVDVTDPLGGRERVELIAGSTGGILDQDAEVPSWDEGDGPHSMAWANVGLQYCNTFHWGKKAMSEMAANGTALDYTKASISHWLADPATNGITTILHSTKQPLESRVWFRYPGQSTSIATAGNTQPTPTIGTSPEPMRVVRMLDDGTAQVRKFAHGGPWGRATTSIDPAGRETEYEYDLLTGEKLLAIRQKNGATHDVLAEYLNYNVQNLPLQVKDAAGQITSYTYTSMGKVLTVTRTRNGGEEKTFYDYFPSSAPAGSIARLQKIRGPGDVVLAEFTYDSAGRVQTQKGADGYTVTQTYDALDRPVRTIFHDGTYTQTLYDKLDAKWQRDRAGRWTKIEHDAMRHVVGVTDPLGRRTQFDWCSCGALEAIVDAKGQRTMFMRDLQMRVTEKVYADNSMTQYNYGARTGRLAWTQDARGRRTNFAYLPDNNLSQVSYTNAAGASLLAVRGDGTKINAPVDYGYEGAYNRLSTMSDGTGTTSYNYHPINPGDTAYGDGRLASVDGPLLADTLAYTYDEFGRGKVRTLNGAANQVERVFDPLGRVSSETNPLAAFTYGYVGNTGRVASVSTPGGFATAYDYWPAVAAGGTGDGDHRLKSIRHLAVGGVEKARHDYAYDVAGNIVKWTQGAAGGAGVTAVARRWEMGYDAADQLTGAEDIATATGTTARNWGWTYDAAATREIEQASAGGNVTLTQANHNNLNQMTSRTGGSGQLEIEGKVNEPATVTVGVGGQPARPVWRRSDGSYGFRGQATMQTGPNNIPVTATDANGNQSSVNVAAMSSGTAIPLLGYDEAGNLLSDGTRTYEWDAASRLTAIHHAATNHHTEFTYDGQSRAVRIVEKTGTTVDATRVFVWEGLTRAEERNAANTVVRRFYAQGEAKPTMFNLLYRRDHLGSVRETTNAAGTLHARWDYDLWGRRTTQAGNDATAPAHGYTGHLYHPPTGLHLAPYRAYSAEMGRWLNRDPLGTSAKQPQAERLLSEQRPPSLSLAKAVTHRGFTGEPELLPEGPNLYAYVANSPVTMFDPLGLQMEKALTIGGGCALADGPFPIGDAVAVVIIVGTGIYCWCKSKPKETCFFVQEVMGFCVYTCPSGNPLVIERGWMGCAWRVKR